MKSVLSAVAVLAVAGSASAAVFSQSQNFQGPLSPFNTTLQFNQLDESTLGLKPGEFIIVKSVIVAIDATVSANITAENNSEIPAPNFTLVFNGGASATITGASAGFFGGFAAASNPLDASDGVLGSGPDFFNFGKVELSNSDDDKTFGPFDDFLGAGTFNSLVSAFGSFGWTGSTDAALIVSNLQVNGTVSVDIIYNVLPTPGAAALFAMAGAAATRRRRNA